MPIIANFPIGGSNAVGLPLAPVTNIETVVASERVYLSWTDPEDITLSEQSLATWAGTLLVRKAGSPPTSRRDGTIVLDSKIKNAYSTSYFCDNGLVNGQTYYYKFFPYTEKGAYTDDELNIISVIPTAQIDALEGWNVGGIVASTEAGDGKMSIKWRDPNNIIRLNGEAILAVWASTTVVVKEGSYAISKDDPDAVYALKVTTHNQYFYAHPLIVTGLTNGTTYYISFFPETTDGGINASPVQRATGVANRITIPSIPHQTGGLVYNGNLQLPLWSDYDSTYMTIGGITSAINAGSYNVSFTPTTDYRWSDGTTTAKTVSWSIEKATGTLTVSKSVINLSPSVLTDIFTINGDYDGTISVVSNNTGIATVSRNGNTVTVSHVNKTTGVTSITVSCTDGINYTAPVSQTVDVVAKFVSNILNENDWSVISDVSSANEGENYWAIGDRKSVTVNGIIGTQAFNETYYAYIIGFNHNEAREGSGITFGTFKTALSGGIDICLVDDQYGQDSFDGTKYFNFYHSSGLHNDGWKGCDLRYDILGSTDSKNNDAGTTTATNPVPETFMAALPSDLRSVMKPIEVYSNNDPNNIHPEEMTFPPVSKTIDYLPLLSEVEVFEIPQYSHLTEGSFQDYYEYYRLGNSRIKYFCNSVETAATWSLRSIVSQTTNFCSVDTNGNPDGNFTEYVSLGISPIFRV